MQKIPTLFERDETKPGHPVVDQVKPECAWVLEGEGTATRKIDGTNVRIREGQLEKRQKPKDRDYDEASYVACRRGAPDDVWAFEAFDRFLGIQEEADRRAIFPDMAATQPVDVVDGRFDGIYELVGPKVQGNPHGLLHHRLVRVVPFDASLVVKRDALRRFDEIRTTLIDNPQWEGLVFHHPDGRLAKIKRRDFGLPWPV